MILSSNLPARPGTYLLHLACSYPEEIEAGKLGKLQLQVGNYLYTGSAHGPGGLRARLNHHLRHATKPHWHLDYLRPHCRIVSIWHSTAPEADECIWARALLQIRGCQAPFAGFGSSDCGCQSHLFWRALSPSLPIFRRKLRLLLPHHGPIRTLRDPQE